MSTKTIPTGLEKAKGTSAGGITAKSPAIERLPDEIIEQILLLASPNVFASLIILNRKWRTVSQQAPLYAHHLSRCPSYSAAHHAVGSTVKEDTLPQLRRLFAQEIRRNLFESYLRPRETVISLVSTSSSSSSAPGGEAFHFSLSPKGHYVLAYSSSRIHVMDVTGPEIAVKRELKILRRPASATITDDGSLLAVLSTDLQVDLYDLTGDHPKHTHAVALDHSPRTIALSPTGAVLAAAYDSGVEVSALNADATSTERRAVKCYAADSLSFSRDGTQLLGTTVQSRNSSTVILTAPYYDPGASLPEDSVSALWTTSILFPNGSRDCSHATLLPSTDGEASWAFTYDRVFETFRAVRIDDLRNGTTYFTGPIADSKSASILLPSTLPAANESGDLVAAGFQGSIWLYGVPEDLEALPSIPTSINSNTNSGVSTPSIQLGRRNSAPSLRSIHRGRESVNRVPQWQLLCDRFRNTFVEGRKIGALDQVSAMNWVNDMPASHHGERLVAVAPGVGCRSDTDEYDGISPVDGGRISILDFGYTMNDGQKTTITIEVGMKEPEVLEEEHRDLDAEVAIVRRRTVAQRGNRNHVSRSSRVPTHGPRHEPTPVPIIEDDLGDPYAAPNLDVKRLRNQAVNTEPSETASIDEQEAFDAPYSHTSPRSGTTLRRAATAAAVNRRLHPPTVPDHIEFRRADGREEHPHESDADNWVPPPPPYTANPIPPLPEHIQRSILAEARTATFPSANIQPPPIPDSPNLNPIGLYRSRTVASSGTSQSHRELYPSQSGTSTPTTTDTDRISPVERPRPASSPVAPASEGYNDLYDISPPSTPPPVPRTLQINQIPRRPVGAPPNNSPAVTTPPRTDVVAAIPRPVSPLQELTGPIDVQIDRRKLSWDIATEPSHVRLPSVESVATVTALQIDKDVPPRPTEDHHLTDLPPSTPTIIQRDIIESQPTTQAQSSQPLQQSTEYEPTPLPRRADTAPTMRSENMEDPLTSWRRSNTVPVPSNRAADTLSSGEMSLPSADQLARLNSRLGRPPDQILADPSRRLSGGSIHQQRPVSSSHGQAVYVDSVRYVPPPIPTDLPFRNTPPRTATGAYSSRNTIGATPIYNSYSTSSHRRSLGSSGSHVAPLSGNLRPPLQRLETIHSAASTDQSPYFEQRTINAGVGRQLSRAERSAAKNIKDAKKRGWRASMYRDKKQKKPKDKYGDTVSSAGWTDVSRESGNVGYERTRKEEKTAGKCLVM